MLQGWTSTRFWKWRHFWNLIHCKPDLHWAEQGEDSNAPGLDQDHRTDWLVIASMHSGYPDDQGVKYSAMFGIATKNQLYTEERK